MRIKIFLLLFLFSCGNEEITPAEEPSAFRGIKSISYNNVNVDVVIDKPAKKELDVLLVFHGTVQYDSVIPVSYTHLDVYKRQSPGLPGLPTEW